MTGHGVQSDRIDQLISVVEKLVSRYDEIEKKLESKSSVEDVLKLDEKINQLEQRLSQRASDVENKLVDIEQHLHREKDSGDMDRDQALSDEDLIKSVVKEEINRKTVEDQDTERRKRNLIFYRVPEKKAENVTERKENDSTYVTDLLDCVFNLKVEEHDIEKMYRLGRWSENDDKVRPLLVTFQNTELKDHVEANLRNLKHTVDKFKGVGISKDLNPKERQEIKDLISDAKNEHSANSSESAENFRFLVVGKGQRRKVIKIKKTTAS